MNDDHQLNKLFAPAASYRLPEHANILHIDYDEFGILTPESDQNILATRFTYTCSGIALISASQPRHAALLHIYSDADHLEAGEGAIRAHVKEGWEQFIKILKPEGKFHATAFGGRKFYEGTKPGKPDQEEIDLFFRLRRESAFLRESEEYKNASTQQRMEMLQRYTSYAEEQSTAQLNSRMSLYVSGVINDTMYELLHQSPFVSSLTDMRYADTPHDAIIERDTGRIIIGRTDHEKLETHFKDLPKTGAKLLENKSVIMPWEHDIIPG